MATIRPLERRDLPAVVALIQTNLGWRRQAEVLERTLLDHPWTPAQPPTLVALDERGQVVGSIGAQARRLVFDGASLRGLCVSHLVVAPDSRAGAAGALLVRSLLAGEQDLTWTDSATEDVVRIWRTFGAHADHARSAGWMLAVRPAAWLARSAFAGLRRAPGRRHLLPVGALPLQAGGRRVMPRAFPETDPDVEGDDASPEQVAGLLPELSRGTRLRIDHDAASLAWAAAQISSLGSPLVQRIVSRAGAPIGWYAYVRQPGVSRLVHLAATPRQADTVFGNFAAHARANGASLISGRLEPNLDRPLRRRFAILGLAQQPLVHSRDPALGLAMATSASLITEMDLIDSEWW